MDNRIGIYVHVPFCKSKCNYCDFNSYSGREHLAGPYFNALFSEMEMRTADLDGRPVKSIFIGGGTPTLVKPGYISDLIELCSKLFKLDPEVEISLESNPGTLIYDSLKAYRAAGINRLSIGLQAWQDKLLKELGRIHDRRQFVDNFEAAVKAGFRNINVDLIFGLPGQTFEEWAETLEALTALGEWDRTDAAGDTASAAGKEVGPYEAQAVSSALTHLSCYSLKIEEGTVFGDKYEAGTLKPADDELDRRMYRYTIEYLARKGFRQYEISNFARPGYECRHNLIYWKAEEYAGFGAGAHSYLNGRRFGNVVEIEQYIAAIRQAETSMHINNPGENGQNGDGQKPQHRDYMANVEKINLHEDMQMIEDADSMSEFMILGLRLLDGVNTHEFQKRFGKDLFQVYGNKLDKLANQGLLTKEETLDGKCCPLVCYKLTTLGLDLANKVFVEFI